MPKPKIKRKVKNSTQGTMTNYPVGDFLIRVKNAVLSHKKDILLKRTKLIESCAKALVKEGYLEAVKKDGDNISVSLAYRRKEPVVMGLKLVSKPGLRVYVGVDELAKRRKPSILIISTPKGVISAKDAIKARVGGEVIAEVW